MGIFPPWKIGCKLVSMTGIQNSTCLNGEKISWVLRFDVVSSVNLPCQFAASGKEEIHFFQDSIRIHFALQPNSPKAALCENKTQFKEQKAFQMIHACLVTSLEHAF